MITRFHGNDHSPSMRPAFLPLGTAFLLPVFVNLVHPEIVNCAFWRRHDPERHASRPSPGAEPVLFVLHMCSICARCAHGVLMGKGRRPTRSSESLQWPADPLLAIPVHGRSSTGGKLIRIGHPGSRRASASCRGARAVGERVVGIGDRPRPGAVPLRSARGSGARGGAGFRGGLLRRSCSGCGRFPGVGHGVKGVVQGDVLPTICGEHLLVDLNL